MLGVSLFIAAWEKSAAIDPFQEAAATMPLMQNVPLVDGIISEEEWRDAVRVVGFVDLGQGTLQPRMATCWFGSDGQRIYAAAKSELPPVGSLEKNVRKRDGPVWEDDAIEIWLAPHRSKTPTDRRYFQFVGNSINCFFDVAFDPNGAWDGDWQFKNSSSNGWWSSEASVSIESLGAAPEDLRQVWLVNVCRAFKKPFMDTSWAPITGMFANRDTMVRVRWDDAAPVTQVLSIGDVWDGKLGLKIALKNPGTQPLDVKVHLNEKETALTLAPGTQETVEFAGEGQAGLIRVTSPDGSKVYFNRAFAWTKKPAEKWVIVKPAKEVDFTAAYYPYHRKIRATVDCSGLEGAENVGEARLEIRPCGTPNALATGRITRFTDHKGECSIETPDLAAGNYVVTLKLGDGVYRQTFERKVFEWEHNTLGLSRKVIPPFTPLEVKGREVVAVLRSHAMNDFGLWDQVNARGEPILAAPIRLKVNADKNASSEANFYAIEPSKLRFVERSADRVRTQASLSGGPGRATIQSEFDYDGMMKVTLELTPRSNDEIQSLSLHIPVKDELATLMHVNVDGVLANYSGKVPDGQGVVWDSSKTVRSSSYGTWVPYVWVGGPERGICIFSDTDRDRVLDDNRPALDLVRKDGVLTLRVHFINTPTKLTRSHRIVFGLQATPVKPRPEGWRRWSFYGGYTNTQEIVLHASGTVWGAASDAHDVYPRDGDFTILRKFQEARLTGKPDWEFIKQWMEKSKAAGIGNWNAVQGGMSAMRPGVLAMLHLDIRNGASEINKYFPDGFTMEPVASYRDCALFYIHKMLACGMDGVTLDEAYLRPNFDTISSDAYRRADGNIQPSMGLFSLRELTKRIAVLSAEMGKPCYSVVNRTNSDVVPARSFATIGIDWFTNWSATDYQDRFTPEYILAESTGLQDGLVPMVVGGIVTADENEKLRLSRTEFGVATVHEIKIWNDGRTAGLAKAYQALYDFGYGLPDCSVYPYWERGQPVSIEGPPSKALVLGRAGKVLVLVTDWSHSGGGFTLAPDRQKLGLKINFTARDAETGDALKVTGDRIRLSIPKHDFRMVIIE